MFQRIQGFLLKFTLLKLISFTCIKISTVRQDAIFLDYKQIIMAHTPFSSRETWLGTCQFSQPCVEVRQLDLHVVNQQTSSNRFSLSQSQVFPCSKTISATSAKERIWVSLGNFTVRGTAWSHYCTRLCTLLCNKALEIYFI